MTGVGELYLKEIHRQFSYLATWLPNTHLELGDVGLLRGDTFVRETTLGDLGIPFTVRDGGAPVNFTWTSKSGISVETKAAGQAAVGTTIPLAQAGVSVKFSREGAFLFQAVGCLEDSIDNRPTLETHIKNLLLKNRWNRDWTVVDTLVRADRATIIVSNSGDASLDLTAEVPVAPANLTNVSAGFAVNRTRGAVIHFIAAEGLAPLFRLSRVKQSIIQRLLGTKDGTFYRELGGDRGPSSPPEEELLETVSPE